MPGVTRRPVTAEEPEKPRGDVNPTRAGEAAMKAAVAMRQPFRGVEREVVTAGHQALRGGSPGDPLGGPRAVGGGQPAGETV